MRLCAGEAAGAVDVDLGNRPIVDKMARHRQRITNAGFGLQEQSC
jgi:hypothetical protein